MPHYWYEVPTGTHEDLEEYVEQQDWAGLKDRVHDKAHARGGELDELFFDDDSSPTTAFALVHTPELLTDDQVNELASELDAKATSPMFKVEEMR